MQLTKCTCFNKIGHRENTYFSPWLGKLLCNNLLSFCFTQNRSPVWVACKKWHPTDNVPPLVINNEHPIDNAPPLVINKDQSRKCKVLCFVMTQPYSDARPSKLPFNYSRMACLLFRTVDANEVFLTNYQMCVQLPRCRQTESTNSHLHYWFWVDTVNGWVL